MASQTGSPRRSRTLLLNGIPYDTHPSKVLERLQALAGRLQRACTTRSSPPNTSIVHSLAAQQRQQQQLSNPNESGSIPGCPWFSQRVYSLKAEFSTREAAEKARDLLIALIAQPLPPLPLPTHSYDHDSGQFGFRDVGILSNFVLEEEEKLLDIPAIIGIGSGGGGCGVCGGGGTPSPSPSPSSPRSEDIRGRRTSAEGIDPDPTRTRKHLPLSSRLAATAKSRRRNSRSTLLTLRLAFSRSLCSNTVQRLQQ
jgi:hypothetical protein